MKNVKMDQNIQIPDIMKKQFNNQEHQNKIMR